MQVEGWVGVFPGDQVVKVGGEGQGGEDLDHNSIIGDLVEGVDNPGEGGIIHIRINHHL
jgi:hypothetical protein